MGSTGNARYEELVKKWGNSSPDKGRQTIGSPTMEAISLSDKIKIAEQEKIIKDLRAQLHAFENVDQTLQAENNEPQLAMENQKLTEDLTALKADLLLQLRYTSLLSRFNCKLEQRVHDLQAVDSLQKERKSSKLTENEELMKEIIPGDINNYNVSSSPTALAHFKFLKTQQTNEDLASNSSEAILEDDEDTLSDMPVKSAVRQRRSNDFLMQKINNDANKANIRRLKRRSNSESIPPQHVYSASPTPSVVPGTDFRTRSKSSTVDDNHLITSKFSYNSNQNSYRMSDLMEIPSLAEQHAAGQIRISDYLDPISPPARRRLNTLNSLQKPSAESQGQRRLSVSATTSLKKNTTSTSLSPQIYRHASGSTSMPTSPLMVRPEFPFKNQKHDINSLLMQHTNKQVARLRDTGNDSSSSVFETETDDDDYDGYDEFFMDGHQHSHSEPLLVGSNINEELKQFHQYELQSLSSTNLPATVTDFSTQAEVHGKKIARLVSCELQFSLSSYKHVELDNEAVLWYKRYLYKQPHTNFVTYGDTSFPALVSIKCLQEATLKNPLEKVMVIVRTRQNIVCCIDTLGRQVRLGNNKECDLETEVLVQRLAPRLPFANLTMITDPAFEEKLKNYHDMVFPLNNAFGILYRKPGQQKDIEMLANDDTSDSFKNFLDLMGNELTMCDYSGKYKGNLSDAHRALVARWRGLDIIFHVAPLLPGDNNDEEQINRKLYVGNDTCVIIFQDVDEEFNINNFTSRVTSLFIIVTPGSRADHFKVCVSPRPNLNKIRPEWNEDICTQDGELTGSELREYILLVLFNGKTQILQTQAFETRQMNILERFTSLVEEQRKLLQVTRRVTIEGECEALLTHVAYHSSPAEVVQRLDLDKMVGHVCVAIGGNEIVGDMRRTTIVDLLSTFIKLMASRKNIIVTNGLEGGTTKIIGSLTKSYSPRKRPKLLGVCSSSYLYAPTFSMDYFEPTLEANHSHFAIVDGAYSGHETQLMFSMAAAIKKFQGARNKEVFVLLVNGSENEKRQAWEATKLDFLLLVLKGSGGVADKICLAHEKKNYERHPSSDSMIHDIAVHSGTYVFDIDLEDAAGTRNRFTNYFRSFLKKRYLQTGKNECVTQ